MSKRFINGKEYQKIRLMYQDEAGFGRISKLGSCWSPKGYRPHVASHHIREYRYCYGAVDAHTGDSFFIIAGGCNSDWMNEFLRQLSAAYPEDYIILVMDNAIWHKSQTLNIPKNIEFTFIPPYTPEMNPIEQVWAEIRKLGFKNKVFKTLNEVIDKLEEVIQTLTAYQLKSIVHRDWTPNFKLKLATHKKFTRRLVVQAFFRVIVNPIFDKSDFFRGRFLGSFW